MCVGKCLIGKCLIGKCHRAAALTLIRKTGSPGRYIEAIPYGVSVRVDYWYPKGQNPHLGPDPRCPQVLKPHLPIRLLIKDKWSS